MTDRRSDGRTVGQTESIIANTALCVASYADALSKMAVKMIITVGAVQWKAHLASSVCIEGTGVILVCIYCYCHYCC